MKVSFTFKHVDTSESLMNYAEERLDKVEKFELQPMDVHFVISKDNYECAVEVTVLEGRRKFKATALSDDFYRSVEMVTNKLLRQMAKDKRRLKHHKNAERSHYGKLNHLNEALESDFTTKPLRKAS